MSVNKINIQYTSETVIIESTNELIAYTHDDLCQELEAIFHNLVKGVG